ncbi:MAG TPA: response regulator [Chthoniobacterales bacterium]|nr:response regulator [Chthoniobacterales bacterium]
MKEADAMVFVVDDDVSMRESLETLIRSVGLPVEVFASAEEFLRRKRPDVASCLVLDVQLPGLSGLDLQSRMAEIAMEIPIVFITGRPDIPTSVHAMKAGAVEFLVKPFGDQELIDSIQQGIERDRMARRRIAKLTEANEALRGCLDALASVPELDKFLGQVMAAITRQLGAASSVLRLYNPERNVLTLDLVFQDGRVMTPAEAEYPERLQAITLDERQASMLEKKATVMHLLDRSTAIPDPHRSYLIGLGGKTLLVIPLFIAKQLIGSLTFRFTEDREFRPDEIELARALAAQASLAIQLTRLAKTATQSAVLEERNRLAGEIHDSLAQSFAAITTQLDLAGEVIEAKEGDGVKYLDRAKDLARFGLAEARRTALSLHPFILEEIGLTEAIQMLVERSNVPGRLQCCLLANDSPANDLPLEIQQHLLRIAQEAISNAVRHANPTTISVSLQCDGRHFELQIQDNGRGISAAEQLSQNGLGLMNMQNRAKKIGATLEIDAEAGRGTGILVRLTGNG